MQALYCHYFPESWKIANILPVKKLGKDHSSPKNYRPISLLSTISKVFERAILSRILKHERQNKILIDEQFGFRSCRSTVHQLVRITNNISNHFNMNESSSMILLDIEKAFDTVWIEGLIHIMNELKFPLYIIKIVAHYLRNRQFVTSINNKKSKPRNISAGVPQGSILAPVLFILFINNIPKRSDTLLALFADDTAILAPSISIPLSSLKAQQHFHEIYKFFTKWKIKINVDKTEFIVFTHKRKKIEKLTIQNNEMEPKRSVKYLGVHLDSKLLFTEHIDSICKKANTALSLLQNLINRKSALSEKNQLLLYKVVIRPILLYACPIWGNTCKTNIKKLETIQNKILRIISKEHYLVSNLKIREKLNMTLLNDVIFANTNTFYKERIQHLKILDNVGTFTQETAPFQIKYKLPHQLLIQPSGDSNMS